MARDPLRILLGVREREVEQVRLVLAACLEAEAACGEKLRSLDDMMRRDREASDGWQDAHQFHEMTATRLIAIRVTRERMEAELAAAEARTLAARGVVALARAAAEAVEQLITERTAASVVEAMKREQHGLDDIARSGRLARRREQAS